MLIVQDRDDLAATETMNIVEYPKYNGSLMKIILAPVNCSKHVYNYRRRRQRSGSRADEGARKLAERAPM